MKAFISHLVLVLGFAPIFMTSCTTDKSKRNEPSIRIGWCRSDKELFAYMVRVTNSNSCQIAVVVHGRTMEGPVVQRPFAELLSLVKIAHAQSLPRKEFRVVGKTEIRRLVVRYGADREHSFTLQRTLPEMLRAFDESPALKELLILTSHNQPKNYRILDDPRASGPFGNPLKTN